MGTGPPPPEEREHAEDVVASDAGEAATLRPPADARWWLWPLKAYGVVAGIVAVWFALALRLLGQAQATRGTITPYTGDWLLGQRANWDGFWYTTIAEIGYFYDDSLSPEIQTSPAFFPGFPMTIRLVNVAVRDPALSGILVSVLAGALGTCLLYRWTRVRLGERTARLTVLALLLYPYTMYFYGIVYSDALFFACAVLAFVALDEDHPIVAGIAGALACSTRLVGVAIALGLVLRLLELRGVLPARGERPRRLRLGRLRPADAGLLLPPLGLAAYCGFLWATYGNPLLFQKAGQAWGQGNGLRTLLKADTIAMLRSELLYLRVELLFQLCLLVAALALTRHVFRRFGWAYGTYTLMILGIPLLTVGNLFGAGRYVLPAFPCFAALADLLARRPAAARRLAIAGATVLFMCVTMFAQGMFVS